MTAQGPISLAKQNGVDLLAATAAFQSFVDAADASEAKGSIHRDALPRPETEGDWTRAELENARPFALVSTWPDAGFVTNRIAQLQERESGQLAVQLEDGVRNVEVDDPAALAERIENVVGQIIAEAWDLGDGSDHLRLKTVEFIGWERADPDMATSQGDHWQALMRWEWGI